MFPALNMAERPPISDGEDRMGDGRLGGEEEATLIEMYRCREAERRRLKAKTEAELRQWHLTANRGFQRISSQKYKYRSRWSELLAGIYFLARSSGFSSRPQSQQGPQSQHCCLFSIYTVYYLWSQNIRIKYDMWERIGAGPSLSGARSDSLNDCTFVFPLCVCIL